MMKLILPSSRACWCPRSGARLATWTRSPGPSSMWRLTWRWSHSGLWWPGPGCVGPRGHGGRLAVCDGNAAVASTGCVPAHTAHCSLVTSPHHSSLWFCRPGLALIQCQLEPARPQPPVINNSYHSFKRWKLYRSFGFMELLWNLPWIVMWDY